MPQWARTPARMTSRVRFERTDIEPRLKAFGGVLLVDAPGGDGSEGSQALPLGVALDEPACVGGAAQTLFDPAVAGVGLGLARAGRGADGVGEEKRGVHVQARLIAFEGEHVMGALVDDAPGDLLLRSHRVDGDDRALEVEHIQEFGNRRDLVDFPSTARCASTSPASVA